MRVIEIVPYHNSWPEIFEIEKELILNSIPLENIVLHHMGSTAVKGLAAKPIIDILLEVDDVAILDRVEGCFEKIGYECKGEFGIQGRRYFQKGGDSRSHQIHAFQRDSNDAIRHLAFRDFLISHENIAREYENIKRQSASNCKNDISVYCALKHDFVVIHEKWAIDWYLRLNK